MTSATATPGVPTATHAARVGTSVGAAARTWLRYVAPLTLLSAVALSPQLIIALRLPVPADAANATGALRTGWAMVATAWLGQLVLVGAAAAIVRARPSQLGALTAGLGQLVRAILPCGLAVAAIAVGSLALVVPGLVLLVLLSLTAASPTHRLPGPLRDSIAVVRRHLAAVVVALAAMLVLDAAVGLVGYRAFGGPLGKPPSPAQLAALRTFVRAVAVGLVIVSPLPATWLATIRVRADG